MVAEDFIIRITLGVIVGTLAAIVYALRILVLVERRIANIENHMDKMLHKALKKKR